MTNNDRRMGTPTSGSCPSGWVRVSCLSALLWLSSAFSGSSASPSSSSMSRVSSEAFGLSLDGPNFVHFCSCRSQLGPSI